MTEQAGLNGWQSAEQVVKLACSSRGINNLSGMESLLSLAELDLSNNAIVDVGSMFPLRGLTRLNLSGNRGLSIMQLRPMLDQNWGLTSLGLNSIEIGEFNNLGPLLNLQTGRPYDLVELDLGNTKLSDLNGGKSLDFLSPFLNLSRLNVAGNGINNINALSNFSKLTELDLSNNSIMDIGPLFPLYTLGTLNLLHNTQVRCVDLDALAAALRFTVIQRPASCVSNNLPPVATAVSAQTVNEGGAVTLAGSGSDSDGTIVSYAWLQTSGPQVTLINANTAAARFTAPQVVADSILTFKLVVTDNGGATGAVSTNVTVKNIVESVDLVVAAASSSVATVKRGSSFYISSATKNAGNAATNTSTMTGLYLSTDSNITTSDTSIGTVNISSLGAGASMSANLLVTMPKKLAAGTYYLGAIADSTQRQTELNETNNSFTGIRISVTP